LESHLVYALKDRPTPLQSMLGATQHVLAMFVGIVTPPLILIGALGLPVNDAAFLISMALLTSGVTTLIQVLRVGPIGSGLLSVQGTSFTFVPLAIQAGNLGGLPLIFGMALAAAPVEILLSRSINLARRLFPPLVTGSVVMLIGMSLAGIAFVDLAGGYGSDSLGSPANLGVGLLVLVIILLTRWFGPKFIATISIAIGLVAGYVLTALLGWVDFTPVAEAAWITTPTPVVYGLDFRLSLLLPWAVAYFVTTMEATGDLTATSAVSQEPVTGPVFFRRLEGGLLADGVGSILAALFNAMPNTTFSQNNGLIALTGVAARRIGFYVAGLLVILGLTPKLAALISVMPKPVLGGGTVLLFGMVAASGLRIAAQDGFSVRNQFILAITLGLGLGVTQAPDAVQQLQIPDPLKIIASSGLAVGGVTAMVLNLVIPRQAKTAPEALEAAGEGAA
jgi:xanthine permease XanP